MTTSSQGKSGTGRRKTTSTGKKATGNSGRSTNKTTTRRTNQTSGRRKKDEFSTYNEVLLILAFAIVIFLFLCTIGVIGAKNGDASNFGDFIRDVMMGLFGIMAYVVPLITFFALAFGISNKKNGVATLKLITLTIAVIICGMLAQMIGFKDLEQYVGREEWLKALYHFGVEKHIGGGLVFGSLTLLLYSWIGKIGTLFVILVLGIVCFVILTGKSFFEGVKKGSKKLYSTTTKGSEKIREYAQKYKEEESNRLQSEEQTDESDEEDKPLRSEKRAIGVSKNTLLSPSTKSDLKEEPGENPATQIDKPSTTDNLTVKEELPETNDIHEIAGEIVHEDKDYTPKSRAVETADWISNEAAFEVTKEDVSETLVPEPIEEIFIAPVQEIREKPVARLSEEGQKAGTLKEKETVTKRHQIEERILGVNENARKNYKFPPLELLGKGDSNKTVADGKQLKETALRLEKTLETFGVKVKVTDFSQGPAVTRYELHPDQGVKVSKIVSLADDIKLNLAASDIRIEAPIPGKMAVGIEVPNKSSTAVPLREMLEIKEFQSFNSNLAFAVGKDIGGVPIVTDIAKMPHLLIAGATGSGKSVCINTLIMSILYKAHPDDVKMIMIDPKVVELSVYNGIPHLMIPVVTDPKQASTALQWGVNEMTERYKKFADYSVRDLKGYNQKAAEEKDKTAEGAMQKMPQIVIIVDELADLMMVASKEVEESICRLAQLARAAGIHLIIATQRPSVDVITGLIKTNMPSRIAFSVSSGIDSRIILDENGAEKLLGKGDMLFFPQGYTKPARVQGAFVSDQEVANVVDYIKNQMIGNVYNKEVEEKLLNSNSSGSVAGVSGQDDQDEYFADAGRFMIEKQKGSIGMLQRFFRIGFNRAARIMDQLEEAGVVSADEGTKPRRILMTLEEFESYLQEN